MAAKGYWVASVEIHDPEGYKAFVAANAAPLAKFGARFLVRGGAGETVEGKFRGHVVVIEFPEHATALACYRSPEYARALALRTAASTADIMIIEGYDGPQPV